MKLTEAEIDKKFRELIALINGQSPDRLNELKKYLDKESEKDGSDKIREMPPARKK
jgi:hypothetical protein